MDVSRENNRIRFYTRDSYILLIVYVYMSSLFLGIALLKNNKWTEKNYVLAIIIYTIIIAFNLVLWYFLMVSLVLFWENGSIDLVLEFLMELVG